MYGFVFSVFAQNIEIQIVPDVEQEMKNTEFEFYTQNFNDMFSNSYGGYFGYVLNTKPDDILKDACKWKGCKRPFTTTKQNELISEFMNWLSENYSEWVKENGN